MNNAAMFYKKSAINTADPADLTMMLYDGAIKFCNKASIGIEKKDIMMTHENLKKAQNIITELRSTLDFKYPVAKDFDVVYSNIYNNLVQANVTKKQEYIDAALKDIRDMKQIWAQLMKQRNEGVKKGAVLSA